MEDIYVPFINHYFLKNSRKSHVSCSKTRCTKIGDQITGLNDLPGDTFLKTFWSLSIVVIVIPVPVHNYLKLLNNLPKPLLVFKLFKKGVFLL